MIDSLAATPTWYLMVVGAVFGGMLASFTMVVLERVPRGESINGRSHCACGRPLRVRENIPVLGWLLSGGRARCCGTTIPGRLLVAELLAVAVGAGVGAGGVTALGIATLVWGALLVCWAVPAGLAAKKRTQQ